MTEPFHCLLPSGHPLEGHEKVESFSLGGEIPPGQGRFLIDLRTDKTQKKRALFRYLENLHWNIISDLSINAQCLLHREFKSLRASFALAFYTPTKTYEFYATTKEAKTLVEDFLHLQGLGGLAVRNPGIGFHFPRTLAMVINEAYFFLEESGIPRKDIDRAMAQGLHYPLGPFAWSENIGRAHVLGLLDELHRVTGESRYRASLLLREEAL